MASGSLLLLLALLAGCENKTPAPALTPPERAKLLTIPDEYRAKPNPFPATPGNMAEGRTRYDAFCALCHGVGGRGDTPLGLSLVPQAPDLTAPHTQKYSDGQLYWIISEGVRYSGMPQGRLLHRDDQMWKLVLYLRQLAQPVAAPGR